MSSWFCLSPKLILDEPKFISEIQRYYPELNHTFFQPLWSTASTFIPHLPLNSGKGDVLENVDKCFEFSPALLSLVPNSKQANSQIYFKELNKSNALSPSSSFPSESFLPTLVRTAFDAATSLQCPSILAGRSSESDDFADVGVYLGVGDYGVGREVELLECLGLTPWIERLGAKIVPMTTTGSADSLSPALPFPAALTAIPKSSFQSPLVKPSIDALSALLSRLTLRHEFRVEGADNNEGQVLHFLVGHLLLTAGSGREPPESSAPASHPDRASDVGNTLNGEDDTSGSGSPSPAKDGGPELGVWVGLASISTWGN